MSLRCTKAIAFRHSLYVLSNAAKSVCSTATGKKASPLFRCDSRKLPYLPRQVSKRQGSCCRWEVVAKDCAQRSPDEENTSSGQSPGSVELLWCCVCTTDAALTDTQLGKICKRILQLLAGSGCNGRSTQSEATSLHLCWCLLDFSFFRVSRQK